MAENVTTDKSELIKGRIVMNGLLYRLPLYKDQAALLAYVQEHYDNHETGISASLGLTSMAYSEWVKKIHKNAVVGDEVWGKTLLYLCFDQQKLIGLLSIRYELPEEVTRKYGDIGYGVRPSERNKGYATQMLQYALKVCQEKGKDHVILGCYQDNIASARTILKNGGVLTAENENDQDGRISQYYLIPLSTAGIEFRKADRSDAEQLIDLYNAAFYSDFVKYGECPAYGRTKEQMEESILHYPKFIILYGGKPVGCVSCKEEKAGMYEVGCLCVIPAYQGRGIGRKAISFIKSYYSNWQQFTLITPVDKEENIRFYTEKCGFEIVSAEMDGHVKVARFVLKR